MMADEIQAIAATLELEGELGRCSDFAATERSGPLTVCLMQYALAPDPWGGSFLIEARNRRPGRTFRIRELLAPH